MKKSSQAVEENFKTPPAKNSPTKIANPDALSRRGFFKTMGASMALMGLAGCELIRRPVKEILPYASRPEFLVPGNPLFYASACSVGEDVYGIVVETHQNRPTKIAGNPLFPLNQLSANAFTQASILNLYDPDRFPIILKNREKSSPAALKDWLSALQLQKNAGENTAVLFPQENSSVFHQLLAQLKKRFPKISLYRYESINNDNAYHGVKNITGKYAQPIIDYKKANVVVSLGADFLGLNTSALPASRDFMQRRKPENDQFNRLYQFENTFSLTGGIADHRFRVKKSDLEMIAYALLVSLQKVGLKKINRFLVSKLEKALFSSLPYLKELDGYKALPTILNDLLAHQGRSVVVAAPSLPPLMHSIVFYINEILNNNNSVVQYFYPNFIDNANLQENIQESSAAAISRLAEDVREKRIKNLISLGGDPVYNAPNNLNFTQLFKNLNTCSLAFIPSETSTLSKIVVPQKSFLEAWSDAQSREGAAAVVQPLIAPLSPQSFSNIDLLYALLNPDHLDKKDDYSLVKKILKKNLNLSEKQWKKALHDGVLPQKKSPIQSIRTQNIDAFAASQNNKIYTSDPELELAFEPDYSLYDGRFINNAWLQEMPDPITKLTWDNAILMSYKTARKFQLKPYQVVKIYAENKTIEGPVWIVPGQTDNSIVVKFGYGQSPTGRVGENSGFSAFSLRPQINGEFTGWIKQIRLEKTNKTSKLASVQDHWNIEDQLFQGKPSSNSQNQRPLFRQTSLKEYKKNPSFARQQEEVPTLAPHNDDYRKNKRPSMYGDNMSIFPERSYESGYQWGMSIDLSTCTGCNACLVACQSENNIPTVGKEMVLESREMHWIRLDRYFDGNPENPSMVHQPVTCLQCETAPCEQVCPVAATVHSQDGLNDMVYNRCVGTRFCSNNCPVKVRRFNYFDYHATAPSSQKRISSHLFELFRESANTISMQFNPDVTVRMRGVMEKCTYCTQRISRAKIDSKNQNRKIQDGEIVPACQETCPTNSIIFGDINDEKSRVSKEKEKERNYHLLAALNLKPRTTYLAAVNNPNESIK